jgi:hypothetical protein
LQFDKKNIYPLSNKWGEGGWTTFEITKVDREIIFAALETAYQDVLTEKEKKKKT